VSEGEGGDPSAVVEGDRVNMGRGGVGPIGGRDGEIGRWHCGGREGRRWEGKINFRKKTCFARRKNRNLALRSGSLFASTQKVHRSRSQSTLHFDIRNIQQIHSQR